MAVSLNILPCNLCCSDESAVAGFHQRQFQRHHEGHEEDGLRRASLGHGAPERRRGLDDRHSDPRTPLMTWLPLLDPAGSVMSECGAGSRVMDVFNLPLSMCVSVSTGLCHLCVLYSK